MTEKRYDAYREFLKDNIRQLGTQINFLETYIKGHGVA